MQKGEDTPTPIGRPIANTRAYVLDQHRQPVPVGIPGELYVGGVGLARGYWNRPKLTAQRFLPDPFRADPGARMYRTGDLVRWRLDGDLEFLGRIDQQVKICGFRIELGEIEGVLGRHPAVRQAVALVREDRDVERCLVAYVVPHDGHVPEEEELRSFVRRELPAAMVPARFVVMETLPLTPSGKVDRSAPACPRPVAARAVSLLRCAPQSGRGSPRRDLVQCPWWGPSGGPRQLLRTGRSLSPFPRDCVPG